MKNKRSKQEIADDPIQDALVFFNKKELENGESVLYFPKEEPDSPDRFAIMSTTENGRYVINGQLFFRFNGIGIYTDINNVIFVDMVNKTIYVKEYDKVLQQINPTDPEKRQYICLFYHDDDPDNHEWESITGRTNTYEYLVDTIDSNMYNPDKSLVITENVAFKDALTVTAFIRYLKNGNLVEDDGFDIDEYSYEDNEEE